MSNDLPPARCPASDEDGPPLASSEAIAKLIDQALKLSASRGGDAPAIARWPKPIPTRIVEGIAVPSQREPLEAWEAHLADVEALPSSSLSKEELRTHAAAMVTYLRGDPAAPRPEVRESGPLMPPLLIDDPNPFASLEEWEKFLAEFPLTVPGSFLTELLMHTRRMVAEKRANRAAGRADWDNGRPPLFPFD